MDNTRMSFCEWSYFIHNVTAEPKVSLSTSYWIVVQFKGCRPRLYPYCFIAGYECMDLEDRETELGVWG
jgi:hypothetical protein